MHKVLGARTKNTGQPTRGAVVVLLIGLLGQVEDKLFARKGHGAWLDNHDTQLMPARLRSHVVSRHSVCMSTSTSWNLINKRIVRQNGTLEHGSTGQFLGQGYCTIFARKNICQRPKKLLTYNLTK